MTSSPDETKEEVEAFRKTFATLQAEIAKFIVGHEEIVEEDRKSDV